MTGKAPVFISYSTPDAGVAKAVCAALENAGVRCWISLRDVPSGGNAFAAIPAALRDASVMILILSAKTTKSGYVERELNLALDYKKDIIPFRIDESALDGAFEYMLASVQWMNAFTPPMSDHIAKLAERVSAMLNGHEVTPQPLDGHAGKSRLGKMAGAAAGVLVLAGIGVGLYLHRPQAAAPPSDDAIRAELLSKLHAGLDPANISVDCKACEGRAAYVNLQVDHGGVTVTGVATPPQAGIIRAVPLQAAGVRSVAYLLQTPVAAPHGGGGNSSPKPSDPRGPVDHPKPPSPQESTPEMLRARAFTMTGQQKLHEGNYPSAKAYFDQALDLDPDNKTAKAGLAEAKKQLGEQ